MREELKKAILQIETNEELHETFVLMKKMQSHLRSIAITQFHVGDNVSFISTRKNIEMKGKIMKINTTTVVLNCGDFGMWRVSPNVLKRL